MGITHYSSDESKLYLSHFHCQQKADHKRACICQNPQKIVLAYTDILLDAKIRLLPLPVKHYCDSLQQTASCVWVAITLLGIASVNYVEVIMQYGLVDGDIFGCSSCPR